MKGYNSTFCVLNAFKRCKKKRKVASSDAVENLVCAAQITRQLSLILSILSHVCLRLVSPACETRLLVCLRDLGASVDLNFADFCAIRFVCFHENLNSENKQLRKSDSKTCVRHEVAVLRDLRRCYCCERLFGLRPVKLYELRLCACKYRSKNPDASRPSDKGNRFLCLIK
jgi:hypothetical protein